MGAVALPAAAGMTFAQACSAVLDHLMAVAPMGAWAVTRVDPGQDTQMFLGLRDGAYGLPEHLVLPWSGSLCRQAVCEGAPRVAPDAMAIPAYRGAPNAALLEINAWVSFPIWRGDGELFGTLCAADVEAHPADLTDQGPLVTLLCSLLGGLLDADLARAASERVAEGAFTDAETDALTSLLNRRGWDRRVALEDERHRDVGDPGAVVVLDLDDFKKVNDVGGHAAGDAHLRLAARALRSAVRPVDVVARLGGDEFAVLVPQLGPTDVAALVDRVREAMCAVRVAASVGSASFRPEGGFAVACQEADARMYADKQQADRQLDAAR